MKILVVGSGAREHTLSGRLYKVRLSKRCTVCREIRVSPKSPSVDRFP